MNAIDDLKSARVDLRDALLEVLTAVAGEEDAAPMLDEIPLLAGPVASSWVMIHDEEDDSYVQVRMRTSLATALLLAAHMLRNPEPDHNDVVDVLGELANIVGGNIKSLMLHTTRLSLPIAEITEDGVPHTLSAVDPPDGVAIHAVLFGQVIELTVRPAERTHGLSWPYTTLADVVETRS